MTASDYFLGLGWRMQPKNVSLEKLNFCWKSSANYLSTTVWRTARFPTWDLNLQPLPFLPKLLQLVDTATLPLLKLGPVICKRLMRHPASVAWPLPLVPTFRPTPAWGVCLPSSSGPRAVPPSPSVSPGRPGFPVLVQNVQGPWMTLQQQQRDRTGSSPEIKRLTRKRHLLKSQRFLNPSTFTLTLSARVLAAPLMVCLIFWEVSCCLLISKTYSE